MLAALARLLCFMFRNSKRCKRAAQEAAARKESDNKSRYKFGRIDTHAMVLAGQLPLIISLLAQLIAPIPRMLLSLISCRPRREAATGTSNWDCKIRKAAVWSPRTTSISVSGCWRLSMSHCWFTNRAAAVNVLTLHVVLTCKLPRFPFSQVPFHSASIKLGQYSVTRQFACSVRTPCQMANKEAPDPWGTFPGTYEPNCMEPFSQTDRQMELGFMCEYCALDKCK